MSLAHIGVLIHKLLNTDTYTVPEKDPLIMLDRKSAVFMDKNNKDTNHTKHIYRRVHLVRNGEKYKTHYIDWCEEGLKFTDIASKNVGENEWNHRIKYIMVRIYNWDIIIVQEGLKDIG